jgi:hypothetical protein
VTPLRGFLEQVHWVSLDELGQQENLDAAIDLLTLPVRPEPELGPRCRRILESRQDLEPVVFSMLFERFPLLSREEILEEGRQLEAAALAIRPLVRRFGSLDQTCQERLTALPLPHLEQLAEDLLDFTGPGDLQAWLAANAGD